MGLYPAKYLDTQESSGQNQLRRCVRATATAPGAHKDGCGGLWEHAYHQGYDSASVQNKVRDMMAGAKL